MPKKRIEPLASATLLMATAAEFVAVHPEPGLEGIRSSYTANKSFLFNSD